MDLFFPKEIVHLDLVFAAEDAGLPCAVRLAGALTEGKLCRLVFSVPGLQLGAVPAEGIDDLLLAGLTLGSGRLVLAADTVKVIEVGVGGVHHGDGLL